ncbi:ABC transporter substrate-binding protein [Bradyrhizobium sp. SZCCHNS3002]|uniref:ABC transporter substrate-binding protein n=1 Tax=unclassified Bradyrhizobium TaxID=2631580 RepID=UPI0039655AFB
MRPSITRRSLVVCAATTSAVAIYSPYIRTAHAAGKLSVGLWQHWIPGADNASTELVREWAEREKVDVQIDYITSQGGKDRLTIAVEGRAKTGHDILQMPTWWPIANAELLEPLNDLMDHLIGQNGPVNDAARYLGHQGGKWLGIPTCVGSQIKGPCSRIDLMKRYANIDVQAMYPPGRPPEAAAWNLETFLAAAEACHRGGYPFGIGIGETPDSIDTAGAIFHSFGADLVNARGDITVRTDSVREAVEYYKKLIGFLPPDAAAWDDASNNKWLISGRGALILNPPSAWAVAKRDAAHIAELCWSHGFPAGPRGRFAPYSPFFWTVWQFSRNKQAAKSLLAYLSQKSSVEKMVVASGGFDLPAFNNINDLDIWRDIGPPSGTLYHYPNPHHHQILSVAASPAPPKIAQQIYAGAVQVKMCLRHFQGEPMEQTLAWAESECEGFMRN